MSIATNNHQRDLVSFDELPAEAQAEFDYVEGDEDTRYVARFARYRGAWHDVFDFVRVESDLNPPGMRAPFAHTVAAGSELARWDGIATDSHGTGVVVRWGTDWDGSPSTESVVFGYWVAD